MKKKVISISGPPGSGKSTLAKTVARALGCGVVGYDDFETMTTWPPQAVTAWLDDGAPMDFVHAPGLRDAVKNGGPLTVYETPFGRACPVAGDLITFAIWIDCPDDVALARKLGALARAGSNDAGFADWMTGWLSAYEAFTRRALAVQRNLASDRADFRLTALDSEKKVAKTAITAVKSALAIN